MGGRFRALGQDLDHQPGRSGRRIFPLFPFEAAPGHQSRERLSFGEVQRRDAGVFRTDSEPIRLTHRIKLATCRQP